MCQVYPDKPLGSFKKVKEEGEQEEEPAHKRVKLEVAGTVKEELKGSMQVHKCLCGGALGTRV